MNLFSMWKNTRMVVLVAVSAALYVAILLPFKFATVVPGITELRPSAAIPVLCSMLFGPPAAWGSAIGNLVGDILGGTLTPGSLAGVIANFCYGLLPFALWRSMTRREPMLRSVGDWARFIPACIVSSAVCAVIVGSGLWFLKVVPLTVAKGVTLTILLNNSLFSILLGGLLILTLYPAARALGLTYAQNTSPDQGGECDLEDEPAAAGK